MHASRPETVRVARRAPVGRIAGATLLITFAGSAIVGQPTKTWANHEPATPPASARSAAPSASSAKKVSATTATPSAPATAARVSASPAVPHPKTGAPPVRSATPNAKLASTTPRVVIVPPKPSSTLAPQDERVTYHYNALGRRDPFQPLIGGGFVGADVGGNAPPDIGGIKVVGIVWGTTDKFALVEDPRGNSLVLRQGDKVMDGYVDVLKRDAVIVKLSVDGQTQTVSIPLTRKGEQAK